MLLLGNIFCPTTNSMVSNFRNHFILISRYHFLCNFIISPTFLGGLFQKIYRDFQDNNKNSDVVKTDEYAYVNNVYNIVTSSGNKVAKEL